MLLIDLATRLEAQAPAREGATIDYERIVQDAVLQLSQDAPLIRVGSLAIIGGTATYALPTDFLSMVEFPALIATGNILNTAQGLVPLSYAWEETWDVGGGQITFYPTPAYSMTRTYRYAAIYELSAGDYPRLTEVDARLALLYGQYLVLSQQATPSVGGITEYSIGDESVKRGDTGKSIMTQAESILKEYQRAVGKRQGYGSTARYTPSEGSGVLWP